MATIARSLWLPVGRENFYSPMTDRALVGPAVRDPAGAATATCTSTRHEIGPYIPHLRESVVRRLVEVLPTSFGYRHAGLCRLCDEPDESDRPVSLTMSLVLDPSALTPADPDSDASAPGLASAEIINGRLRDAGVTRVDLQVDEHGFYTFVATHSGVATAKAEEELAKHVTAVFGGDFAVDRLTIPTARRQNEGMNAVRRYNGLAPLPVRSTVPETYTEEAPTSPPLGALSFYQLNIMIEALCNQSLLPAVFFEHYHRSRAWLARMRRQVSVITNLDDFIGEVARDVDARTPDGQIEALRRFMVISRGSLQWMTRSVDSVRRSLLDQMMAVSHRRARLVQLDLAGVGYERTPELTGEATESQMRGYVVLVATKLPLIQTISECAEAAVTTLLRQTAADEHTALATRAQDLDQLTRHWAVLLRDLRKRVRNLGDAVAQDWQERLLYEQEQARSEQEAMAEIERSRRGLPDRRRTGDLLYNAVMLILTAITVVVAIPAVGDASQPDQSIPERLLHLWPLAPVIVGILFGLWALNWLVRYRRQRRPNSETYGYEFAYRLDEIAAPERINRHLRSGEPRAIALTGFRSAILRPLGGWRTDKISPETELIKARSVVAVRVGRLKYARFEIVVEIVIRRISEQAQYFLRHCRVFGDSPLPIDLDRIESLSRELVWHACEPMVGEPERNGTADDGSDFIDGNGGRPTLGGADKDGDGERDLAQLTALTGPIYGVPTQRRPVDELAPHRERR